MVYVLPALLTVHLRDWTDVLKLTIIADAALARDIAQPLRVSDRGAGDGYSARDEEVDLCEERPVPGRRRRAPPWPIHCGDAEKSRNEAYEPP